MDGPHGVAESAASGSRNMASSHIDVLTAPRKRLRLCLLVLLFVPLREPVLGKFDLLLANRIV